MAESRAQILALHSARVAAFRELDAAFRQFLLDEQELIFGRAVAAATAEFSRISAAVLAVAEACGDDGVRDAVGRLQRAEQAHLAATVRLQTLQKAHFIDAARALRTEEEIRRAERSGTNVVDAHAHCEHHPVSSLADKVVPFDEIYNRQAAHAAKDIAQATEVVNDVIEELREDVY